MMTAGARSRRRGDEDTTMLDLRIALLRLNFADVRGHEHRIRPIATRAASILAQRLEARYAADNKDTPHSLAIDELAAPVLSLDLGRTSDEQAAARIAGAWLEAIASHPQA
jgi:hypothetical protein